MKATLESTAKVAEFRVGSETFQARLWQGDSAKGVPMHAWIISVGVRKELAPEAYVEFETDLAEAAPLRAEFGAIPLRFII